MRLHPVARYFPSDEKRTQHTTLSKLGFNAEKEENKRPNQPFVHKRVHQADIQHALDLWIKNSEPITTLLLQLGGDVVDVQVVREAAGGAATARATAVADGDQSPTNRIGARPSSWV